MANLIYTQLPHQDDDNSAKFEILSLLKPIKRVFWIYNNSNEFIRGKHRHHKSNHVLICTTGSCKVYVNNGTEEQIFFLDNPTQILHLEPTDWREMYEFSNNCVLACFCDKFYDPNDYIYTPYQTENTKAPSNKILEEYFFD